MNVLFEADPYDKFVIMPVQVILAKGTGHIMF